MRFGLLSVLAAPVLALVLPATASADGATLSAPSNEANIVTADPTVVASWTLAPGWTSARIELSDRPETRYPGGPFLFSNYEPEDNLGVQDTSYAFRLTDWDDAPVYGTYYWHVMARYVSTEEGCSEWMPECVTEKWSGTYSFTLTAPPTPPVPPAPTCSDDPDVDTLPWCTYLYKAEAKKAIRVKLRQRYSSYTHGRYKSISACKRLSNAQMKCYAYWAGNRAAWGGIVTVTENPDGESVKYHYRNRIRKSVYTG